METRAVLRGVSLSPRKARLVAKNVKGRSAGEALDMLKFTPQKAAGIIRQVLYSAISNADNVHGLDADELMVKEVLINEGPSVKRFLPRAQGRATQIIKRTSHITVILAKS